MLQVPSPSITPILVNNFMSAFSRTLQSLLEVIINLLPNDEPEMIGPSKWMMGLQVTRSSDGPSTYVTKA
jgi:hypothetical protein